MPGHPISSRKSQFPIGTLIMAIAAILLRAKRKKSRRIRSPIFSVLKPAIPSELPESFCSNPGNIPSSFSQKVFLRARVTQQLCPGYPGRVVNPDWATREVPNPPCPATKGSTVPLPMARGPVESHFGRVGRRSNGELPGSWRALAAGNSVGPTSLG